MAFVWLGGEKNPCLDPHDKGHGHVLVVRHMYIHGPDHANDRPSVYSLVNKAAVKCRVMPQVRLSGRVQMITGSNKKDDKCMFSHKVCDQ